MAYPGIPDGVAGTFGGLITQGNARRGTEVLHRSGIAAIDTLATPGVPTASDVVETSASLANSPMHFAVAAANRHGPTTATVDGGAVTPTVNHALLIVVAQVAGADGYHIFLSTAAAPLYVGYITEAQRATGDRAIVTMGTVTARSSATVAGTIVVGIVGTGVASTAAPFLANFAFTPHLVTPLNCDGSNSIHVLVKMSFTDYRVLPTLFVHFFQKSVLSPNDWFRFATFSGNPFVSNVGIPAESATTLTTNGATSVVALVGVLTGQGASVDIWLAPVT